MKRFELINEIIEKKGYTKYLEIGIDDPNLCFNKIVCGKKIGVDPYNDKLGTHQWTEKNLEKVKSSIEGEWYEMTSDEFFSKKRNKFDLIFIDGLHKEPQIDRDIENSLKRLNKGGMIVMHDTMPKSKGSQTPDPEPGIPWVGTCYRSFWKLRMLYTDLDLATLDIDTGFSLIRPGKNIPYKEKNFKGNMSYMYWKGHKSKIMNLINLETFRMDWLAS